MNKMSIKNLFIYLTILVASALSVTSCDTVYDDEGDCSATYKVRFRYDMNMKYADAFAHEVHAVSLFILDSDNNLVWKGDESGAALAEDGYAMTVNIKPGTYRLLAWCTTNAEDSYTFYSTDGEPKPAATAASVPAFYSCVINNRSMAAYAYNYDDEDDESATVVNHDLDALYHGMLNDVEFTSEPGEHVVTIPLTKDTNRFRIILQHISNEPISADDFTFEIEADNAVLNYDNSVDKGHEVVYYPWYESSVKGDIDHTDDDAATPAAADDDDNNVDITVNAAEAELTVSRLMADDNPHLIVRKAESGEVVFRVPIIDYVTLVKGHENASMSDQEYLDRQDEYNMTFFLDKDDNWQKAFIYINSWKVVLLDKEL
jgi:hypothetical protein